MFNVGDFILGPHTSLAKMAGIVNKVSCSYC